MVPMLKWPKLEQLEQQNIVLDYKQIKKYSWVHIDTNDLINGGGINLPYKRTPDHKSIKN